ncbi:MAG: hypothetical protein ABSF26_30320 [Thermoguttaceae bacterium]|jgi:hypothetical protein
MPRGARVTTIDAVRELAAALGVFRTEAAAALDELEMQIRRALEWIHHDRREYWDQEVQRGWERVSEARVQLQQATTARRLADHDPACIDEKKALALAKRRLEVALQKVELVRHCARDIDHVVSEYRGCRTHLTSWLEAEVPRGLSALDRMSATLESYVSAPVSEEAAAAQSGEPEGREAGDSGPSAEDSKP